MIDGRTPIVTRLRLRCALAAGTLLALTALDEVASAQFVHSPRWSIKVLTDRDLREINFTPETTSVAELLLLPTKSPAASSRRLAVEKKTYCVVCRLVATRSEGDGDLHLIVADTADASLRMTAEIPDSTDPDALRSGRAPEFGGARRMISTLLRGRESSWKPQSLEDSPLLEITGVGFYDSPHFLLFKTTAPNNFEIHPVLRIEVGSEK